MAPSFTINTVILHWDMAGWPVWGFVIKSFVLEIDV